MNKIIIIVGIIVVVGVIVALNMRKKTDVAVETATPSASASVSASPSTSATPVVSTTPSAGLKIQTLIAGKGPGAKNGDTLAVLYKGMLTDGRVFDESAKHGNIPFELKLGAGSVIQGWEQGLIGIKVGEKRRLTIPGDLAYGANGIPGTIIGPNATLVFEVTLVKLNPPSPSPSPTASK